MQTARRIGIFALAALLAASCTEQQRRNLSPQPIAIGSPAQTLVVVENSLWESPLGDSLRYYLEASFPLLPAPEPMLDLTQLPYDGLVDIKKQWKNIVFVGDLKDSSSTSSFIRKSIGAENALKAATDADFNFATQTDRWAKGQLLVFLFGNGYDGLLKAIQQRQRTVIDQIYKADKRMVSATVYAMRENNSAIGSLRDDYGVDLRVPGDFRVALNKEKNMWLRKETSKADLNILIRKLQYDDRALLSNEGIIKIRNEMGKAYISSHIPESYMTTDVLNLTPPVYFNQTKINDNYAVEARGIWRMENDFMGGAFISYLILDAKNNELVFLDGFVYAPEQDKRKYIQQFQVIFESLKFL